MDYCLPMHTTPNAEGTGPAATLENYKILTRQGAGSAASALFPRLSPADQAAVRAMNASTYPNRDHGSRFD